MIDTTECKVEDCSNDRYKNDILCLDHFKEFLRSMNLR